jgi:long-chain acyl-CoA synthetase
VHIDFFLDRFEEHREDLAVVWRDQRFDYGTLRDGVTRWSAELERQGIASGAVVGLEGDFSPSSIALLLALIDRSCIVVPHSNQSVADRERKDELAQVEHYIRVDIDDEVRFERTGRTADHELFDELRRREHPGLVLFSSGTSGVPKAAVHDFLPLLTKFRARRAALVTVNFLLFDHWGGLNTMFSVLSTGGTVVTLVDRSPDGVCRLVEELRVGLLPATPTFLNLMLISGAHRRHDLSSLRVITYGAEPMPQSTLDRMRAAFPGVKLQQTYGLIEVGVLSSKSREDGSLWVRVGGEGYETRVVGGILQIRTPSTILGYLNAPSPMTEDGWFITGDAVLQDGDWLHILGRASELINVGGEKVYPTEVEDVILQLPEVEEVTVYGERNPLIGNVVCATVRLRPGVDDTGFSARLKRFCADRLDRFKVPVKVRLTQEELHGDRFKKTRAANVAPAGSGA